MERVSHRPLSWQLICLCLVLGLLTSAAATITAARQEKSFIVELARSPSQTTALDTYHTRYTFDTTWFRGASIDATHESLFLLQNHPDVVRVWPVQHHPHPSAAIRPAPIVTTENKTTIPLMTQYLQAYKDVESDGKGITIGIIDSGVDYSHPALGGCFGADGCKFKFGADLVGSNFDGSLESISESDDPMDDCTTESFTGGHGTFVSGVIGADDQVYNWKGIAPGATLGMWRVYGCKQAETPTDVILKAMEMAAEHVDIISMSIGINGGWDDDALSAMANRIVAMGKHVVCAIGNSGSSGAFLPASPSTASQVIAVGAISNPHIPEYVARVHYRGQQRNFYYRTWNQLPLETKGAEMSLTTTGLFGSPTCLTSDQSPSFHGAAILVQNTQDSNCSLPNIAQAAAKAGASAVIVYTNTKDKVTEYAIIGDTAIPVAFVNWEDGQWLYQTAADIISIELGSTMTVLQAPEQELNTIEYYSSLGPTNTLDIKPELVAVGGNVFSTLPVSFYHGYGVSSGTSMSAPTVAGALALFLSKTDPSLSPAVAKSALMNFAQPARSPLAGQTLADHPVRQGAGILSVAETIRGFQQLHVSPPKLNFNDTAHYQAQDITLHNHQSEPLFVWLRHEPGVTLLPYDEDGRPYEPAQFVNDTSVYATLTVSESLLIVEPGQTARVTVGVQPPPNVPNFALLGGSLVVDTGRTVARIPYLYMNGNMTALPILYPSNTDNSALPSAVVAYPNGTLLGDTDLGQFQPSSGEVPCVVVRLAAGTELLQMQVMDSEGQTVIGDIPMDDSSAATQSPPRTQLIRNTQTTTESTTTYSDWAWFGDITATNTTLWGTSSSPFTKVPTGTYRIRLRALRIFGDRQLPSDWDVWTSPPLFMNMIPI